MKGGADGQAQQPALAASAGAAEQQVSAFQEDGVEGAHAQGSQQLGFLRDATLEAGIAADGGLEKELGSVMKMAVLSEGS
jgi:hypothetical protein